MFHTRARSSFGRHRGGKVVPSFVQRHCLEFQISKVCRESILTIDHRGASLIPKEFCEGLGIGYASLRD